MPNSRQAELMRATASVARFDQSLPSYSLLNPANYNFPAGRSSLVVDWLLADLSNNPTFPNTLDNGVLTGTAILAGTAITGSGIPGGTTILNDVPADATTATMSANATATAIITATIGGLAYLNVSTTNGSAVVTLTAVDGVFRYTLEYDSGLVVNPQTSLPFNDPALYSFRYSLEAGEADTIFLNFQPGGLPTAIKAPIITFDPGASFMGPASTTTVVPGASLLAVSTGPAGCKWVIHVGYHYELIDWRRARPS